MDGPVRGSADREARRNDLRQRRRRRRRTSIAIAAGALLVVAGVAGSRALTDHHTTTAAASTGTPAPAPITSDAGPTTTAETAAASSTAAEAAATTAKKPATTTTSKAPTTTPAAAPSLAGLSIENDPIPYGAGRRAEMAGYSDRHYGIASSRLDPKLIVLHYTAGDSYQSAWSTFAADTPAAGPAGSAAERPGTCSHFIVDQQGTIHQLVPLTLQCRHTIGLNRWAIGIEMVQSDAGHDSTWATDQILHRTAQIDAVTALVRALMARYHLSRSDVIGHGTANGDPRFVDLEGWRNDHTDWLEPAVRTFRRRL